MGNAMATGKILSTPWRQDRFDPDNWLMIPELDVKPKSVKAFVGFEKPLVLADGSADDLILSMRYMTSVARTRLRNYFLTLNAQKKCLRKMLSDIEAQEHDSCDPSEHHWTDYLEDELPLLEPPVDIASKLARPPIREFSREEHAAFDYMIVINSLKRALDAEGRDIAVALGTASETLIRGFQNEDGSGQLTAEERFEFLKGQLSRKANDQRHDANRTAKAFVFRWLDANRIKFTSMDKTANAIPGLKNPANGKIVAIEPRTARDWVGEWTKKQPPKRP
jgi:hypothetical protein